MKEGSDIKNLETKYICSLDERLNYIEALGIDYAFVIDFSSIAKLTAYEYETQAKHLLK